ncbi:MAG: TetR/AcrR family transcriptional regulator [Pseudomonadota bacterium]
MADQSSPPEKPRTSYHHGDLPGTLTEEAARLLSEKGADGFSMREVARRAGVAVAAPSHHFGNAKGLLTSVASCGFEALKSHQEAAMDGIDDPEDRVIALCKTYVDMGRRHPGYAAVMFRWDLVEANDARYSAAAKGALDLLKSTVADAAPVAMEDEKIDDAAKALWAAMHGFVTLSLADGEPAARRIAFTVRTFLAGLRAEAEE